MTLPALAGTIVIDEAQRRHDLFPLRRVLVDQDRRNGRPLVLGSAGEHRFRIATNVEAIGAAELLLGGLPA